MLPFNADCVGVGRVPRYPLLSTRARKSKRTLGDVSATARAVAQFEQCRVTRLTGAPAALGETRVNRVVFPWSCPRLAINLFLPSAAHVGECWHSYGWRPSFLVHRHTIARYQKPSNTKPYEFTQIYSWSTRCEGIRWGGALPHVGSA